MTSPAINFHSIEQVGGPRELRPFVRFPFVKPEAASHLAKAIDFEAQAGLAVTRGQLEEAEHLRAQSRAAWSKYRANA